MTPLNSLPIGGGTVVLVPVPNSCSVIDAAAWR